MVSQVEKLTRVNTDVSGNTVHVQNYSSSVLPEGKLHSEERRIRMIKLSKSQNSPRLYDLTELCPGGDKECLEGLNNDRVQGRPPQNIPL